MKTNLKEVFIINISVIGDEVASNLDDQIRILKSVGINNIEIRKINDSNIVDCSYIEIQNYGQTLTNEGMTVTMISTNIGKKQRTIKSTYDDFHKALDIAKFFKCKYIRIFSDLTQNEANNYSYIIELVKIAKKHQINVVLENETNTFAFSPANCKKIIEKTNNELGLLFDPGNFFKAGFPIDSSYNELQGLIVYIHLKDMIEKDYTWDFIGNGDMKIILLLKMIHDNFCGCVSLEPHFCIENSVEREKTFLEYYKRFKKVLFSIGDFYD